MAGDQPKSRLPGWPRSTKPERLELRRRRFGALDAGAMTDQSTTLISVMICCADSGKDWTVPPNTVGD